ncbi:MAG: hypothetical protein A2X94_06815 [Bdellovibrionales bacterium GWB1_55_8]|nr:MAG: hypothetical protein A2X94_06815 [Bdellovibrionales bacterium GWB1_55_8]
MSSGPFLYPNVTSLPGQSGIGQSDRLPRKNDAVKGEFDRVLENTLGTSAQPELDQMRAPLKFSAHATQRLRERNIKLDPAMMAKVSNAVDKADAKGLGDTLVLTPDAALIVSVKNRTVITALDKNSMSGNVFTNIDGAVIV